MTGACAPSCSPRCPQLKPPFSFALQTLFPNIILSVSFETRSRCFSRISAAKQRQQEVVKSEKKRTGRRRALVKPPPDRDDTAFEAEAELQAPTVGRRTSSHPSPLPKPPAGFVLDARGKVLLVSNKRIATIVDATNNLPLECVIRRVFQSSRGDECMLLCPVDTPVQILKSTNFSGWSAGLKPSIDAVSKKVPMKRSRQIQATGDQPRTGVGQNVYAMPCRRVKL